MSKLLPCPFCGKENTVAGSTERMILGWWYACEDCFENRKGGVHEDRWNTRPIEDALNARIAELEADKERLNSCESALISMVNQFFYSKDDENILRHSFMSAEEEAAEYLVEHGIARWAGKNKSAICFNEV